MEERRVADVMNGAVINVSDEATLEDAIERMRASHISALVVTDHSGHMVGVISQTDLLHAWRSGNADALTQPVSQHMTRNVVSCSPHKPLSYAMQLLNEHQIHRLVVVETHDGGRFVTDRMMPVGVLSQTDIVRALAEQTSSESTATANAEA